MSKSRHRRYPSGFGQRGHAFNAQKKPKQRRLAWLRHRRLEIVERELDREMIEEAA